MPKSAWTVLVDGRDVDYAEFSDFSNSTVGRMTMPQMTAEDLLRALGVIVTRMRLLHEGGPDAATRRCRVCGKWKWLDQFPPHRHSCLLCYRGQCANSVTRRREEARGRKWSGW